MVYPTYRNDYGGEEDYEESGQMLSPPVTTKILYLKPDDLGEYEGANEKIYKGDAVCVYSVGGGIKSYNGITPLLKNSYHTIAGIALADAVYEGRKAMGLIPVMVAGDVVVTLPAAPNLDVGGGSGAYYVGDYIDADGVVSHHSSEQWRLAGHLMIGQILTGKTDGKQNTRLYKRYDAEANATYYHVAVRLCLGARLATENAASRVAEVDAYNSSGKLIADQDIVVLQYDTKGKKYIILDKEAGALSNGVACGEIGAETTSHGKVAVAGSITYKWVAVQDIIAKSPRARIHPIGVKVLAARARNEEPNLDEYFVGMRVTEDLLPILSGVPGNQFGHITEINAGTPPNEAPTITIELDPVATFAPAPEAEVDLETESVNEDTPIGTCIVQNPITGAYVPCRFDTDNVDGVLDEAVELPTIYGWTLQDYRAYYGPGVFYANGRFWKAIKKFAKGVYTRVIKPAAKWAISIARPLAGQVVTAAGNVLQSYLTTKTGALVSAIEGIAPHENAPKRVYTSITGKRVEDDDIVQDYVDDSGSYSDDHPNHTYTYDIDTPTNDDEWALGDCLAVNADTGKAEKITSYETPIEAIVNWEPAQEPITNGWKIAGIARGYAELRSDALKVGMPVLYDGTDASTRLAAGQATAVLGRVREVWQPSAEAIAAARAKKQQSSTTSGPGWFGAGDEELPNCIIEVDPVFHPAVTPVSEKKITTVYFEGVPSSENGDQA